MSKLNILFVNPPAPIPGEIWIRDTNRSGRYSKERTIWPQTSLAMLASMFPDDNVQIFDCIAEGWTYKECYDRMAQFQPTWVVLNPVSSSFSHDMIVAMYAHSLGAKTVCVSPHTKVLFEESQKRFPFLDYSLDYTKGGPEYEYQLRELIKGIPCNGDKFEDLPPARQDLLPIEKYSLPLIGKGYTFVTISRGCAWACIYCRATVQNERKPRFRSVNTVLEEIRLHHLTNIAFHADTATMNRKWMMEFCERVLTEIPWKIRIVTNSRVDTIDPEMLSAMKRAGFWMICFGVESGNDRVLAMNKKEATVAQARQAVKAAKRAGLKVWTYLMLGMYGDTKETMQETIRLACELDGDICNFAVSAPYPGTEWGRVAQQEGYLTDQRWESMDQNYSAITSQPDCSPADVLTAQKSAYLRWYGSWRGIRFLLNAWRPQYSRFLWQVAKNHGSV